MNCYTIVNNIREVYPKGVEKRKKAAYPKSVNFKLSKRGRRSHP